MKDIYNELIQNIKQATPLGANSVDTLTDIIPMSKEAAYRRLRNEINFSFDEVVKIAKELNVSLDNLIGLSQRNRYNVQMTCVNSDDLVEQYRLSFEEIIAEAKKLKTCSNPVITLFTDMLIPFSHTFKYETIAKFRLFKWTFRWNEEIAPVKMHEITLSSDIIRLENELYREMTNIPTHYICMPELIQSYVRNIQYCQKINLITDEDVLKLKNETFRVLDDLESDATTGMLRNKAPFYMYLCNSYFNETYLYYGSNEYEAVTTQLFGVGFYFFKDIRIINQMKNWINTLIRDSTLISVSGEKQRFEFFRRQRLIVDTL